MRVFQRGGRARKQPIDQRPGLAYRYVASINRGLPLINTHTGVQGGSHMSNFAVREMIVKTLSFHHPPGQIATLLNDFERQKCQLDWTQSTKNAIHLHGTDPRFTVPIYPKALQTAFDTAFSDGLVILEQEVRRVLDVGLDFVVILCGGSYFCKGLRNIIEELMAEIEEEAQTRGIRVKHLFLAEYDVNWYGLSTTFLLPL